MVIVWLTRIINPYKSATECRDPAMYVFNPRAFKKGGNRQQLEWAINYLEANYQSNFADNEEHGSIDWTVKTSSLDPEERVVTQHL
eukprot:SAG22_NODE_738_length_7524_cov_57.525522_3_plen_86_part_00